MAGGPSHAASVAGGGEGGAATAPPAVGVQQLIDTLLERVQLRPGMAATGTGNGAGGGPAAKEPFLFYMDHCFAIKGQGTVLTGRRGRGGVRQAAAHALQWLPGSS